MSDRRVDDYIKKFPDKNEIILKLRNLLLTYEELEECIKWNMPIYTYRNKNLIGLGIFKHFTSLWFYEGALLKDESRKLVNAQKGKTQALRQWRFKSIQEIDEALITSYVTEAIDLAKSGHKIQIKKSTKLATPPLLENAFDREPLLKNAFEAFPPYKQREFIEHLLEAKRDATKEKRLSKILELIKSGTGLNDKYRK